MKQLLIIVALLGSLHSVAISDINADKTPTIKSHTAGLDRHDGLFTYYWDDAKGKIWLEIDDYESEFLYINYLSRGLGSNDIGLDRGQIGGRYVIYFRRIGPKVLMMERNHSRRATAADPNQQLAVDESFAQSTLWGFEIVGEHDGRVLVDATDFIMRDARDVVGALRRAGQGRFSPDMSRSTIDPTGTMSFPKNTEFEALLTYTGDTAGYDLRQVAPTPVTFTIGQHHSLVELPEPGYKPRTYDPRCGYGDIGFVDYSAPLTQSNSTRFIMRHRLEKKTSGPAPSEVVEPIVYYVDRGTPEPLRTALVEGASWWNEAFAAAGFINAFRVELMPEDADPFDVRYNTIQWVHRSTRGWSYGNSIVDPRTGEVIKGHVTLGSLRARQDYLIAEGILAPYEDGTPADHRMEQLALARLRQLSCHEVGHTLGLRHNFAASANERASVMDYPFPYVTLANDGSPDLSDAYTTGIGDWDKAAIAYGYEEFADGVDEDSALSAQLDSVYSTGLMYITDADARPPGGAHPYAHLWDNGSNAIDELDRLLAVRRRMLDQFSERVIQSGTPTVMIEEALVPIYMFHRYQLEAVTKFVGGVNYQYAVRDGHGDPTTRPVDPGEQRRAIQSLLNAITSSALMLRSELLNLLPPQTISYVRPREIFSRRTGDVFDLPSAAESVADIPIRLLLNPERAARLELQHAADESSPGLGDIVDRMVNATWHADRRSGLEGTIQRTVDNLVLHHLIRLANSDGAAEGVRAIAYDRLVRLEEWLGTALERRLEEADAAHMAYAARRIQQFMEDPGKFESYDPVQTPAGSPIGSAWNALDCDLK